MCQQPKHFSYATSTSRQSSHRDTDQPDDDDEGDIELPTTDFIATAFWKTNYGKQSHQILHKTLTLMTYPTLLHKTFLIFIINTNFAAGRVNTGS